jgi:BirA family biotin operon repressor/biotin-[acetyl-CoA-carboxylase] ligase
MPQTLLYDSGSRFGRMSSMLLIELEDVDSTLNEALRTIERGVREPFVLTSARQTGGYGRFGRPWESPPGNLYWTAGLIAAESWPQDAGLTFAAGLAVSDALRRVGVSERKISLKWPNDVLIDGRKVSGILLQAGELLQERSRYVLVGIGINVAQPPLKTFYDATCIMDQGLNADVSSVQRELTTAFVARLAEWKEGGLQAFLREYALLMHGLGTTIRVTLDRDRRKSLEGKLLGLNSTGALMLELPDGTIQTVHAGDVASPSSN